MANWETTFVKIIKEICEEEGILLTSFDDWAFCLTKDGRHKFIYGYQFFLDDAAKAGVLKDKAAASEMMRYAGIPCVPHWCVMNPKTPEFATLDSGWHFMEEKLSEYKTLVIKDNLGTGGRDVYKVSSRKQLEQAAAVIFDTASSLAVCPYVNITDEYRLVMLNKEVATAFKKIRPNVCGDGVSSVRKLLADKLLSAPSSELKSLLDTSALLSEAVLGSVPQKGEVIYLKWKHNLGQGAKPLVLKTEDIPEDVKKVAQDAAKFFDLGFSSVDVIVTGEKPLVLEINGGVMMENLAGFSPECYELAKSIYRRAILGSL